jgi:hypothetical protein
MGTGLSIIFYSTIAGLSTILGIAFFHLFPESLELSEHAVLFIFAGFLLFYLLENVMVVRSGSGVHFKGKGNPLRGSDFPYFYRWSIRGDGGIAVRNGRGDRFSILALPISFRKHMKKRALRMRDFYLWVLHFYI